MISDPLFCVKGDNLKISFYYVNGDYIEYLKNIEVQKRGFTTVPNVSYGNRRKFVYGAVLEISSRCYYVPVSSYTKAQRDNLIIKVKDHNKLISVGSLRFNYMIPVPKDCLLPLDFKSEEFSQEYKILLEKEYKFCKTNRSRIQKLAKKTYERIISAEDEELVRNSCMIKTLEEAHEAWEGESLH